jgi:GxxExxY protein
MPDNELSRTIIGCAMKVSSALGPGFLEKVYENALVHEMRRAQLEVRQQAPLKVTYDGVVVGEYTADIIVEDHVIVELKAAKAIDASHQAQMLNYMRATGIQLGLLLNFGAKSLGIKRMVI